MDQKAILGHKITTAPPKYPEAKPLSGRYVYIQPFDAEKNYKGLYKNFSQTPGVLTYVFQEPTNSEEEYRKTCHLKMQNKQRVLYTIFKKSNMEDPVGIFCLMNISLTNRSVQIGAIEFSTKLQKTTQATELLFVVAQYVFQLGFLRFQWKCNSLNVPSRKAAQRFGFNYEGKFKKHMLCKGYSRDTLWFSITDDQWPLIRQEYIRWLNPDNFDEKGNQKTKLSIPKYDRTFATDSPS